MLTYETLPEKVKDYFRKNITISVAFVKKDGVTVRHMAFRRNLNAYEKSEAEKTDAQINKLKNNNLMLVYDTNLYIKAIKSGADTSGAAKASYRNFRLENVLAFMCGGEVYDMREENGIAKRYGDEIAGQLTKGMIFKMYQDDKEAEGVDNVIKENYKFMKFIKEEIKKLNRITLLEEQKMRIEGQLKLLNEDVSAAVAQKPAVNVILKDYIDAKKVIFDPNGSKITVVRSGALGGVADFHKVFKDVISKLEAAGYNPTNKTGSNEITVSENINEREAYSFFNDRNIKDDENKKARKEKEREWFKKSMPNDIENIGDLQKNPDDNLFSIFKDEKL